MKLIPTIWRTCRVLANPSRLRFLQAVLRRPGRFVSELAKETGIALPVASQYLRDLQARGVLSVERRSRWVFYGDHPDPSVGHAAAVLDALRAELCQPEVDFDAIVVVLKGLTHPRRIVLLRQLAAGHTCSLSTLRDLTSISLPALVRHLAKLESCGLACRAEDGIGWQLVPRLPPLAQRLMPEIIG